MATITASGASSAAGVEGVLAAVRQAQAGLKGAPAACGLLFASPDRDLAQSVALAQAALSGTRVIACSTAGEITQRGLTHGGVAVLLVATDEMLTATASATQMAADPARAARELCRDYPERSASARARGWGLSTTFLLADGLGAAERLVEAMVGTVRFGQRVVGGGAADEGRLKSVTVAADGACGPDSAACVHFFGGKLWGVGVGHGLRPASAPMRVTKAAENLVHELDGRAAMDVYRGRATSRGIALDASNTGRFFLENALGLFAGSEVFRVRTAVAVGPDDALVCAGAVPQGSSVCFMTGTDDEMLVGVRHAAAEAKAALRGGPAAGVLLVSCICRGNLLGNGYDREIEVVREAFPGVPIAGFLSYGEFARYQGILDGYHTNTVVIVAIPG